MKKYDPNIFQITYAKLLIYKIMHFFHHINYNSNCIKKFKILLIFPQDFPNQHNPNNIHIILHHIIFMFPNISYFNDWPLFYHLNLKFMLNICLFLYIQLNENEPVVFLYSFFSRFQAHNFPKFKIIFQLLPLLW